MRFFLFLLRSCGRWLLGAATLFGSADALAQTPPPPFSCGFDRLQQAAFARQPGAEAAYRQFLTRAAQLASQPAARGALGAAPDITVPVVVHILFSNPNGFGSLLQPIISDAQVNDALRIANLDFSKSNADTLAVIPAFQGRIANVGFRFRLAKIDPNGNCTTGITRSYARSAPLAGLISFSGDVLLKQDTRWDPRRYLNIWVVYQFGGVPGGYAYLPCADEAVDGIVIDSRYFGSIGTALGTNFAARALSHELGHHFGLLHTFGQSNSPGQTTNCGAPGDGVADTPPTVGTYSCDLAFTSCPDPQTSQPVLANVQNYMDYAACTNMFTVGQRAVMRASVTLGCRSLLVSAANLVATGTNDGYQPPAGGCPEPPLAGIFVNNRQTCPNLVGGHVFTGWGTTDALNAPTAQVQWSFPGGVPATATGRSVRVNYSTPGVYPVTVTITPAGGGPPVSRTEPNFMLIRGPGTGLSGAVNESFENPAFPNSFGPGDLRNWLFVNQDPYPVAFRWQRASGGGLVAADGTACLVVPNSLVPPPLGTYAYSVIVSPALDLSALKGPGRAARLSFRTARATHPNVPGSSFQDELLVQYGTDCEVYSNATGQRYFTGNLQVLGQTAQSGFVPTSAQQWTTITLPLNPQYIGPATWFRFTFQTKGGNPFYLDRVRIEDPNAPLAAREEAPARDAFAVYPNPAAGELRLRYPAPGPTPTGLRLYDALGRLVRAFAAPGRADEALSLRGLAAGVYVLRAELAGRPVSRRVAVAE